MVHYMLVLEASMDTVIGVSLSAMQLTQRVDEDWSSLRSPWPSAH